MADFSVKWEYEGFDFVPIPHPCYKWVVHKSKEQYEKYCRSLLLMEKPGCYLSNIGTEFDSCEAELKDFVENSEFCSNVIKENFKESQEEKKKKEKEQTVNVNNPDIMNIVDNEGDLSDFDPELPLFNDSDDLYIPEQVVQGDTDFDAPLDDDQIITNLGKRARCREIVPIGQEQEHCEGEESDYDSREFIVNAKSNQWNDFAEVTVLKPDFDIYKALKWIDHMKDEHELPDVEHQNINVNTLNKKQKVVYDLVTDWMSRKNDDVNTKPFYLNLCGSAGCGKSHLLKAITHFAIENGMPQMMKRAAPTANAAYLIDGTTLHGLLRIPVPIIRGKPVPELCRYCRFEIVSS